MTLINFKAANHPQQTAARGAKDNVDDRWTDPDFIAAMEKRFGPFDLDVAASAANAKAPEFYTIEDDGLSKVWHGQVWCNPPYSDIRPWLEKAWSEWRRTPTYTVECDACGHPATATLNGHVLGEEPLLRRRHFASPEFVEKAHRLQNHRDVPASTVIRSDELERIVMLLPANRTEQKWWQELVEPFRDREGSPLHVEFLPGRMRFERPGWTPGPKGNRPPFGCVLLIWGSR